MLASLRPVDPALVVVVVDCATVFAVLCTGKGREGAMCEVWMALIRDQVTSLFRLMRYI